MDGQALDLISHDFTRIPADGSHQEATRKPFERNLLRFCKTEGGNPAITGETGTLD
tara:strand:- start:3372 stop:3539 length:168 start_codon:yes stop_codon:yes gene_type:complete